MKLGGGYVKGRVRSQGEQSPQGAGVEGHTQLPTDRAGRPWLPDSRCSREMLTRIHGGQVNRATQGLRTKPTEGPGVTQGTDNSLWPCSSLLSIPALGPQEAELEVAAPRLPTGLGQEGPPSRSSGGGRSAHLVPCSSGCCVLLLSRQPSLQGSGNFPRGNDRSLPLSLGSCATPPGCLSTCANIHSSNSLHSGRHLFPGGTCEAQMGTGLKGDLCRIWKALIFFYKYSKSLHQSWD